MWLRQSTASQEILLGRFVNSTDGNTEETGLTIANTDIKLWMEGATTLANKNSGGATHIANGMYYAVLDATDTATLGKLEVNVHVSGALSVRREFMVLPANVYDSLVLGTDVFQTDVTQWNGTNVKSPTTAGVPEVRLTPGVVHGGANTQLNLFSATADPALYIYNNGTATTGAAIKVESLAGVGLYAYGGFIDILAGGAGSNLGTVTTNITGSLSGSVGSVTGAVGSVTGNVGGNVMGSVGSLGATAQGNVRTAVGLASANLDTQLGDIPTNSELATALITGLTTALTEGYRGAGATGSVRDLLYEIIAHLGESSISGTTKTLKKLDGSTTAKTYTLNISTIPTAITETT